MPARLRVVVALALLLPALCCFLGGLALAVMGGMMGFGPVLDGTGVVFVGLLIAGLGLLYLPLLAWLWPASQTRAATDAEGP